MRAVVTADERNVRVEKIKTYVAGEVKLADQATIRHALQVGVCGLTTEQVLRGAQRVGAYTPVRQSSVIPCAYLLALTGACVARCARA